MENKGMKREFQWARRIIVILTAIVFIFLLLGSFGMSFGILLMLLSVFSGAAWLICFLGTGISRKMIQIGDKISNKFLRVLYYSVLLPLVLVIWLAIWAVIENSVDANARPHQEMGEALSAALIALFWGAFFMIFVLVPYVQSLLVLLLSMVLKKKGEEEGQEIISE